MDKIAEILRKLLGIGRKGKDRVDDPSEMGVAGELRLGFGVIAAFFAMLILWVALAPCVIGYGEIGVALAANPQTAMIGNPYRAWIESYASPDYQAVAWAHGERMEILMARRGGPGRLPALIETFRTATKLEAAFWDMGLAPPARD